MNHSKQVKQYYEQNTRRFIHLKKDVTKSIHQPLWKEDSYSTEEAYNYSNQLILKEIQQHKTNQSLTIIDLGCGVGSSIFYLQQQIPASYYGITISPTQIALAKQKAQQSASQNTIQFLEADFTNLPKILPKVDIAFSIEAFIHAPNANKYFEQISQHLKTGGKLILIDDFLTNKVDINQLDKKSKQAIQDFRYGWLANSLTSQTELVAISNSYGLRLIDAIDLTPYMRNNTWKHKWIRLLVTTFRWLYNLAPKKSYYFRSWIGGQAKQYCFKKGLIQYRKVVFEKM